jgi:UDP-2,3-diacylglucosamine pyrophosphatase LpxH
MYNIIFTGDWHIGDRKDAQYVSKWLKEHINPKTDRLILIGDLIDTGISRGMGWNQESVNRQIIYLKKILERYKILGYVLGNHERRIVDKTGLNPYQMYMGEETTEYFTAKDTIQINIQHGKSGAQNQALELVKLANIHPFADIVALGHTHDLGIYMLPTDQDGVRSPTIGLRTGSLQRYPKYAERAIMVPKVHGCIRFYPETKQFEMIY